MIQRRGGEGKIGTLSLDDRLMCVKIWSIGLNVMTLFLAPTVPLRSVEYDLGSRNSFVQWIMVVKGNLKEKVI